MKIQQFKLHEKGLLRYFGPLEAEIMDILWSGSEMTIKEVHLQLEKKRQISFNTVMTVMNRLVDKEILVKRSVNRKRLYHPMQSREHFLDEQSKLLSKEIISEYGLATVNHMLDEMNDDADDDLLDQLEKKIQKMKNRKES